MATILVPLPNSDFDPTEAAVPWQILTAHGHAIQFATPDGRSGQADERVLTGKGLGILATMFRANATAQQAYRELESSKEFGEPLRYEDIRTGDFDAVLLPGGHAPGMKPYLESAVLQSKVAEVFEQGKPVAAICHGVLVAARSTARSGRSVLFGRRTTALPKNMELTAWALTRAWLGDYYRTYPTTVEDEVRGLLARPEDFIRGPLSIRRDSAANLAAGFTVLDGHYLSARWPGDAHRFGSEFAALLQASER
jgi:protease I